LASDRRADGSETNAWQSVADQAVGAKVGEGKKKEKMGVWKFLSINLGF